MPEATNALLGALPVYERDALDADLVRASFSSHDVVYAAGGPVAHVYFPVSGLFAENVPVDGRPGVEVRVVGRDGVLGAVDAAGTAVSSHEVVCQVPGQVLGLPGAALLDAVGRHPSLRRVLMNHNQAIATHVSQRVVCVQHHSAEQRCATWVLQAADRLGDEDLALTQQLIAHALGLRRATVSVAAARFQATGLVRYRYGRLTVVDRTGLQDVACRCYRVVRDAQDLASTQLDPPS